MIYFSNQSARFVDHCALDVRRCPSAESTDAGPRILIAIQHVSGYIAAAQDSARATGAVTLFSSHRLSTAKNADLIIVFDEGEIVEMGNHRELVAIEGGS